MLRTVPVGPLLLDRQVGNLPHATPPRLRNKHYNGSGQPDVNFRLPAGSNICHPRELVGRRRLFPSLAGKSHLTAAAKAAPIESAPTEAAAASAEAAEVTSAAAP